MVLATTHDFEYSSILITDRLTRALPSIPDVFSQCCASGHVTPRDRVSLMEALLNPTPLSEDLEAIDRLLHGLKRGWLQLADDSDPNL